MPTRERRAKALGIPVNELPDGRGRHGKHATGDKHGHWNEGRWSHADGYVAIKVYEGHHLRQANGYAYEHQIEAEKKLGRRLQAGEVVHHINGIKADNRHENLVVMTNSEHRRQHIEGQPRDRSGRFDGAYRSEVYDSLPDDLKVREFPC